MATMTAFAATVPLSDVTASVANVPLVCRSILRTTASSTTRGPSSSAIRLAIC
jgi:hypothetical protein